MPAEQAVQFVEFVVSAYIFIGHCVHVSELYVSVYDPAGHTEQMLEFEMYIPAGQIEHIVEPLEAVNLPLGQGVHDSEPRVVEYVPLGQGVH